MEPQLKQRLVGAAVLVALAVLFIPTFLHTAPRLPPAAVPRDIAPMPAEEIPPSSPILEPLLVTEIDNGLDASTEALAAQVAPSAGPITDLSEVQALIPPTDSVAEPLNAVKLDPAIASEIPQPQPSTDATRHEQWTIQLGSFASEGNAKGLVAKLHEAGFTAFLTPLEHANKRQFRVRVGTTATRQEAERLHARLAQTLGYTGMVVRNE